MLPYGIDPYRLAAFLGAPALLWVLWGWLFGDDPAAFSLVGRGEGRIEVAIGDRLTGEGTAMGPDTLVVEGVLVRLEGVDAFEPDQSCVHEGARLYRCGDVPQRILGQALSIDTVTCIAGSIDPWGRVVGRCQVQGADLGAVLVTSGYALAIPGTDGAAYAVAMADAQIARRGAWAGPFMQPWYARSHSAPF